MDSSGTDQMTPDQVTAVTFETRLRGVDSKEVAAHLQRVADVVRSLIAENASLRAESERLEGELASRTTRALDDSDLDEDQLTEKLGHEAGRVLAEARAAAADRMAQAEAEAADITALAEQLHAERSRAADLEVGRIRAEARSLLEQSRADAEAEGDRIRQQAETDAATVGEQIERDRQGADAEAARVIREAELTRRQILEDLARRRSLARRQIEQLRAGRERLLASHEVVRRALDEVSEELTISMSEARAAAETAGHSVTDTTIEELEAEIETARLTGLLDTGPVPVVGSTPSSPVPAPEVEAGPADSDVAVQAEPAPEPAADLGQEAEPELRAESAAQVEAEPDIPDPPGDNGTAHDTELAEVLQLDRARGDVDTAKHPAAGREKSSRTAVAESAAVEVVPDPVDSADAEHSVDDLFARMRSSREVDAATKAEEAAKTREADQVVEEPDSDGSGPDPDEAAELTSSSNDLDEQVAAVSDELARRLKRVLADEQSEVMSTLRGADKPPTAVELLGTIKEHRARYWVEVEPAALSAYRLHSGGKGRPGRVVRAETDEMVGTVRRRVEASLSEGGNDLDAVVESLRSVYREVKTQRLNEHAESVCRMAADLGAARS